MNSNTVEEMNVEEIVENHEGEAFQETLHDFVETDPTESRQNGLVADILQSTSVEDVLDVITQQIRAQNNESSDPTEEVEDSNVETLTSASDIINDLISSGATEEPVVAEVIAVVETAEIVEDTKSKKFNENYEEMGLTLSQPGVYHYQDSFGEVFYKELKTTDDLEVPFLGLYTRPNAQPNDVVENPKYVCIVSNNYQFTGNDALNQKIRDMISEIRTPIFREYSLIPPTLDSMYHEMVIQNMHNVPQVGDVYPEVIITNSYNGRRAITVSFGFVVLEGGEKSISFGFRNKLSSIRQVHVTSARSTLSAAVGNYVQAFSQNALSLIETNFNTVVTDDDLLKMLDLVEKVGKKRRVDISNYLSTVMVEGESLSTWKLFNAICKFSTLEKNINAKLVMEDIAERVLVIPLQIAEALVTLNEAVN
jgi:hypothetical protein